MSDKIIDIPGVGQVAFPSSMSDDEIAGAIKTKILPQAKAEPTALDKVGDAVNTGVNWAGTQLTKGATALLGTPKAAGDLVGQGALWAGNKIGMPGVGRKVAETAAMMTRGAPSADSMNRYVFGSLGVPEVNAGDSPAFTLTNPLGFEGKVNVGKMLDVGAQALPGALALGGGALPAFLGGVTSEAAGQATEGTPYELPARIAGSLPGAWLGSKIATPLPANLTPQQARAVQIAKDKGIPLTVAQETGRGRNIESAMARFPTSAGPFDRMAARQANAADRAALKEAGFVGDEVGAETMKALRNQVSGEFQAARDMPGLVEMSPKLFDDVAAAAAKHRQLPESMQAPAVERGAANIIKYKPQPPKYPALPPAEEVRRAVPELTAAQKWEAKLGILPDGDIGADATRSILHWFGPPPNVPIPKQPPQLTNSQYQALRKSVGDLSDDMYRAGQPDAGRALAAMRNALDDAAGASLSADKVDAWKTARRHYQNFKIIEKAAGKGTVASRSAGTLSPSSLTTELRKKQGDAFSSTTGGLNDVATLKQYLADTFPNSGTPTMQAYQGIISGGAGLGAAGLTGAAGFGALAPQVAIPAAAAMVTPNLMARAMTGGGPISNVVRNYLANQAQPSRLQSVATVPFALAPGLLTDQRLRLMDQRGGQ